MLATQGIHGGANRKVLERIKKTGDIFWAQSDRDWILDGANVHVSMVAFDDGTEKERALDGIRISSINSDLTRGSDLTAANALAENAGICFMGDTKGGPFDISQAVAEEMLKAPLNPNDRPNSDVIRPWSNGSDIAGRSRGMWVIDFGVDMSESAAALYEAPFQFVRARVKPLRDKNRRMSYREKWWIHAEPRPALQTALSGKSRYIATVAVAKHRLFVWLPMSVIPDHALFVFAREDDYFLGVLQSRVHEVWALRRGTALEDRPRYTPTTTFETFPLPWPPGKEPENDSLVKAINTAAKALVENRDKWLNPPDSSPGELKKRTLTNLYNQRPQWLEDAHRALDDAVLAAYGWPHDLGDTDILERLLRLNQERSCK